MSAFFGVSVDCLINDKVEVAKSETTAFIPPARLSKLNVVLISILALMLVAVIALSVTVGVKFNKSQHTGSEHTVAVNGFEITYLSDETSYIDKDNKTLLLNFNIYNSTDYTKIVMKENFAIDNNSLHIVYITPDECPIEAREELKLKILIEVVSHTENLGMLRQQSVTVKYAGREIATVKWGKASDS